MAEPRSETARASRARGARKAPERELRAAPEARSFSAATPPSRAATPPELARRTIETVGENVLGPQMRGALAAAELWRESVLLAAQFGIEFSNAFFRIWGGPFGMGPAAGVRRFYGPTGAMVARMWGLPASNFRETPGGYCMTVELPRGAPGDLEVRLEDDALIICGQKHDLGAPSDETKVVPFERRFPLPPDADRSALDAELHGGLLEINMPKRREASRERRRIEVHGD